MDPLGSEVDREVDEVVDLAYPSAVHRACLEYLEFDAALSEQVSGGDSCGSGPND
jgi:hypothetical protein